MEHYGHVPTVPDFNQMTTGDECYEWVYTRIGCILYGGTWWHVKMIKVPPSVAEGWPQWIETIPDLNIFGRENQIAAWDYDSSSIPVYCAQFIGSSRNIEHLTMQKGKNCRELLGCRVMSTHDQSMLYQFWIGITAPCLEVDSPTKVLVAASPHLDRKARHI